MPAGAQINLFRSGSKLQSIWRQLVSKIIIKNCYYLLSVSAIFHLFNFDILISPPRTNAAEIIIKFLIMYCPSSVGRKKLFA
jgi:hypothetical protein